MIDFLSKSISKIFSSKTESDYKKLAPIIDEVNAVAENLKSLSNDELRNKTLEFRNTITEYLADTDTELNQLNEEAESNQEMDAAKKEDLYSRIDALKKERNKKIEEVLSQIQAEAFAVVRETARRFTENAELEVTATDNDRQLVLRRDGVKIEGDRAIFSNTWTAAGTKITWNMVHYDVQLIGGSVLHQGKIAEMATGEGKTLVATLPIYLNALPGAGVHVVTVNDYLAKRDAEWNGPIFEFLGLTVDCIDKHQPNTEERRNAYKADITYGTNNEFGFDYLRDNMTRHANEMVQRPHHYAIVDEVDSVLIDDARTPLIISGPTPKGDTQEFFALKPKVEILFNAQRNYVNTVLADAKKKFGENKPDDAGMPLLRAYRGLPRNSALVKFLSEQGVKTLLQKTENHYMQDQQKEMHKVDAELFFVIDEKNNTVELTEKGIELITANNEDANFFVMPDVGSVIAEIERSALSNEEKLEKKEVLMRDFAIKSERIHTINQLLKAYTLFERDVEYIIAEGKVKIVDEQTGRVLEGRRYSDGLHQAIEAKESVKIEAATQTYATITLQNYFRMYHKLAGMTGTAETEAGEFWEIYKLDVVVIPTNKKIIRDDRQDLVYKTRREKYNAVIEEIAQLTAAGRPVLVGTTSVEISELLSRMLKQRNIKHNVLNAKLHKKEADIVAEAGQAGTVTIATNMAGRGTDIKLGPGVKEAGGLAIVGTERHDSRRVDRQLRGRAGRQGDPGSSQFFVSLEDDLMRLFGSERIARLMDRMGLKEGEVIQHSMITKSIERAQKKVEENNFGIRKRLLEYDDVMNAQREVIYKKRRHALFGERLALDILNLQYDVCDSIVSAYDQERNFEAFQLDLIRYLSLESPVDEKTFMQIKPEDLTQQVFEKLYIHYKQKSQMIADKAYPVIESIYLNQGKTINEVVVPFADGQKAMNVLCSLAKAYETKCKELITSFEKTVVLSFIDEAWTEHLREMDELRTSVQNAVYEQKDPLLIYKFESFELFKRMLERVNKEIVSFLEKGFIPVQNPENVQEARPQQQRTDMSKLQTSHTGSESSSDERQGPPPPPRQQPAKAEVKVGRNDPCPCGSGKKFKNCHGANS
ncbi:MAG TPA: preprotein translocase subunit SecA [Bacteroidia bacterium]|nr:MAG: Preprotein translocase subunit SecA [Bacteroidetes bacterium OLB10]MBX3105783.1 preprotein translocase subunit SecA [Bacteroidota bacterium]MCB8929555.1 preprotein translocase subunit SecA [Bacteroidia bacterium]OQB63542.1 MAG: preprotein translocase subunit SecA [Bacteroidetes bacterium ADurb.Bin141]MCW5932054.1 preprotein translocase subunit SecA [Bacteroidota bacterium]